MPAPRAVRSSALVLLVAAAVAVGPTAGAPAGAATAGRIGGADRIATAVALSTHAFTSVPVRGAVLAVRSTPADALAAAPLAAALGGPLLLSDRATLRDDVASELERLDPGVVYLMGGTAALSQAVEDAVVARFGRARVVRLEGADRFDSAAAAATTAIETWGVAPPERVLIALGQHPEPNRSWPDALGAGVLGGYARWPILLVRPDAVPTATVDALRSIDPGAITIVGGTAAISQGVADELAADGTPVDRIGGTDRYDTARLLAVAAAAHGADPDDLHLATGRAFPDGLAAGPATVATGRTLLLVDGRDLDRSPATRAYLEDRAAGIVAYRSVGLQAAVSDGTQRQVGGVVDGIGGLSLRLVPVASGTTIMAVEAVPGSGALVVAEREGVVREVGGGTLLDITSRVRTDGERGLLGLAFHPGYASNGRFFVHYSRASDGDTVLAEFRAGGGAASEQVLLRADQPASNHNGGDLRFGPDGMLYLALGDGGGGGDTYGNGQDPSTPLGALLRLDVSTPGTAAPAAGNPFAGGGGDARVWAYGLRNPYRGIDWDLVLGTLFVADVGQSAWEEVNAVPWSTPGVNFGWPEREGAHCYRSGCTTAGLTDPVLEYANAGATCAITGGRVYRGEALGELRGHYLYADFCEGTLRSFGYRDGRVVERSTWLDAPGVVYTFGTDAAGEWYVSTGDTLYRVERA